MSELPGLPAGEEAPDLAAEVLGFRGWRVSPSGLLMSAAADDGWVPGENVAICPRGMHQAPASGCGCGLYAHYDFASVPASMGARDREGVMIGAVAGWGRVILHPDGWRAERARVLAFFRQGPASALARSETLYGVPVVDGPWELPQVDAETVPEHMRPAETAITNAAGRRAAPPIVAAWTGPVATGPPSGAGVWLPRVRGV